MALSRLNIVLSPGGMKCTTCKVKITKDLPVLVIMKKKYSYSIDEHIGQNIRLCPICAKTLIQPILDLPEETILKLNRKRFAENI